MSITTGPVAAEEFDAWFATMGVAFATDTSPEQLERAKRRHRQERSMAARDGDTLWMWPHSDQRIWGIDPLSS